MLRTGVVVALATGALVGISAPAYAAAEISNISLNPGSIGPGEQTTVNFKVKNNGPAAQIDIEVTSSNPKVTCNGTCTWTNVDYTSGQEMSYSPKFRIAQGTSISPGETATLTIKADNNTETQTLNLEAPQAPQNVAEVSGQVYDLTTGAGISAATVAMQDGAGGQFAATADSQGRFKFTSTAGKPIVPGTILVGAVKNGYGQGQKEVAGQAGATVANVRIGLRAVESTASAAPLPSFEAAVPSTDPSVEAINPQPADGDSGSNSMFSMLLIGMGGLLVALGIGAIVLLLLRRRGDDDDDEEDAAPVPQRTGPRSPAPRPAGTGVYRSGGPDPTMIPRAAAIGDRTMITRPTNASTTVHRPVPGEEYGDGYGGRTGGAYGSPAGYPSPQPPGYPSGGYTAPQAQSYGYPTSPARPPAQPYQAPGYGSSGGQYSGYEREEPAPRYESYSGGGYAPNGYEHGGGYESGGYAPNGYDQGGYGQPPGGYEPRGYEQGYDQRAPEQRAGYGSRDYDQYYEGGSARQPGRSARQPLDWLDD